MFCAPSQITIPVQEEVPIGSQTVPEGHIALLLSRVYGWPLEEVTEIWKAAQETARVKFEGTSDDSFKYALTVAENMLRIDASLSAATWWDKMPHESQRDYLKEHPESKRKLKARETKPAQKAKPVGKPGPEPKDKPAAASRAKKAISLNLGKVRSASKALGKDYKFGMKGLRNFKQGKKLTPRQSKGLKNTAKVVGGLLLVAVAGIALFTPLGGMAADLGHQYLQHLKTTGGADVGEASAASTKDMDEDHETLDEFQKGMTEWLMAQDPKKLAEKIRKDRLLKIDGDPL